MDIISQNSIRLMTFTYQKKITQFLLLEATVMHIQQLNYRINHSLLLMDQVLMHTLNHTTILCPLQDSILLQDNTLLQDNILLPPHNNNILINNLPAMEPNRINKDNNLTNNHIIQPVSLIRIILLSLKVLLDILHKISNHPLAILHLTPNNIPQMYYIPNQ